MSYTEQIRRVEYIANGITSDFVVSFDCTNKNDISVYVDSVQQIVDVNFSVTFDVNGLADYITLFITPSNNSIVIIQSNVLINRATDFNNNTRIKSSALSVEFDRLYSLIDELKERLDKKVGYNEAIITSASNIMPNAQEGFVIGWENNQLVNLPSTLVSAAIQLPNIGGSDSSKVISVNLASNGYELSTLTDKYTTSAWVSSRFTTSAYVSANFGAIGRSINFVTPEQFGAVGDSTVDDTTAVVAALATGKIVILNGLYRTTSTISVELSAGRRSLSIFGAGKQQSGFYITHSAVGFDITMKDVFVPIGQFAQDICLRDFSIVSNGAHDAGVGIKVSGQPGIGSSDPTFRIDNVAIRPNSTSHYFAKGMQLNNIRNGTISNCDVFGYWNFYTGTGIELAAVGSAAPIHIHITDCNISNWDSGIRLLPANVGQTTSDIQGVHIRGNNIIAVNRGIYAETTDKQSDQIMINENHCNFRVSGIQIEDWKRVFVDNNFLLANGTVSASTAHGILLITNSVNSIYGFVSNNCVDFSSPTNVSSDERGIRVIQVGGAARVLVNNNMIITADIAYELPADNILTTSAVSVIGGINNYSA